MRPRRCNLRGRLHSGAACDSGPLAIRASAHASARALELPAQHQELVPRRAVRIRAGMTADRPLEHPGARGAGPVAKAGWKLAPRGRNPGDSVQIPSGTGGVRSVGFLPYPRGACGQLRLQPHPESPLPPGHRRQSHARRTPVGIPASGTSAPSWSESTTRGILATPQSQSVTRWPSIIRVFSLPL